jgi:hypothetical protein
MNQQQNEWKIMNAKFDELTKSLAQSVTRRAALKKFGGGLAGIALAAMLAMPTRAESSTANTSEVFDPAGDSVFPYDLFGAPVPPYLDFVRVSVSSTRGTFRFEFQMNAKIPANADPGFSPQVNHLGPTIGLLTDPATAEGFNFFGHTGKYRFNYYVGALYSAEDSGAGLGLGWHGFLIELNTFTVMEVSIHIKQDTLILEVPEAILGNPAIIAWAAASECDPVSILDEKRKGALLVDYVPNDGYATWSAQ